MKTPDEIVKALRICSNDDAETCLGCPYYALGYCECSGNLKTDALVLIDSLQSQLAEREREAQRWIPVSERLPEAYIPVLVHRVHSYCDNDDYSDIRITARTNVINRGVADWMETGYAYIVTHWMPLPAAPEKGE